MELKDELLAKAKQDKVLLGLGTEKEIADYFEEEWHELELHSNVDSAIEKWKSSTTRNNLNNLVIPYLMDLSNPPNYLEHKWFEGDYPDIDMDFEPDGREKILNYLREKWGANSCFQVATWGIANAKSAMASLGRVMGIDAKEIATVNKRIAYQAGEQTLIDVDYLENKYPELKAWFAKQPKLRQWLDKILGCIKNTSINASAMVIAPVDVTKYLPLARTSSGEIIIGAQERHGKKELQGQGFIKFDILGLHNLKILRETVEKVKEIKGVEMDWNNIDLEIPQIYKAVNKYLLQGIFQLDSVTARNVISHVHPETFMELSNTQTLIRPGNINVEAHKAYERHKLGQFDRKKYPVWLDLAKYNVSERVMKVFGSTYGILLYQEQIMLLVAEMGGFSLDETNKIRKTINTQKKQQEQWDYIEYAKNKFITGSISRGMPQEEATFWWDTICGNLEYSFNASHSISYSVLSYRELYLKVFYPLEFYWSLLRNTPLQDGVLRTSYADPDPLIRKRIDEAKMFGVNILPPDVNKSNALFDIINKNELIHGLCQIREVGPGPAADIIARRPYRTFEEFLEKHVPKKKPDGFERSGVTKRAVEGLIWSGAFDKIEPSRSKLLDAYAAHRGDDLPVKMTRHEEMLKENDNLNYVYNAEGQLKAPFGCLSLKGARQVSEMNRNIVVYGYVKEIIKKRTKAQQKLFTQILLTDFVYDAYVNHWRGNNEVIDNLKPGDRIKVIVKLGLAQRLTTVKILTVEKDKYVPAT